MALKKIFYFFFLVLLVIPLLFYDFNLTLEDQAPKDFVFPLWLKKEEETPSPDYQNEIALIENPLLLKKPIPQPKAKLKVKAEPIEFEGWRLLIDFPKEVDLEEKVEEKGIYLSFNQEVDSPDWLEVQEKLAFLIKRLSNGFYTLYIEGKKPLYYTYTVNGHRVTLDIVPDLYAPMEETRSIKLAKARLQIEERNYEEALQALEDLENEYPHDKDIAVLKAGLVGLYPQWQKTRRILDELQAEYPQDEDITLLANINYTPHAPFVGAERQVQRTVGLAAVQAYRLFGENIISASPFHVLYAGLRYQLLSGHISGVINSQGVIKGFRGVRNQAALYLRNEWLNGNFLTGTLFGQQSGVFGVGADFGGLIPQIQGDYTFTACWHRPYWPIFETFTYYGREDIVKVHANSTYNRYLSLQAEVGAHRVGIKGTPHGFSSIIASAQLFYNLKIGNPTIAFNYGYDAEYITRMTRKRGIDGVKFEPVPYVSFENHSLRGYLYYRIRDHWLITGYAGETFNRLGLNAPTYGMSIHYDNPLPNGWEFEFSANHFPSTIVQGATGEYFTWTIKKRF